MILYQNIYNVLLKNMYLFAAIYLIYIYFFLEVQRNNNITIILLNIARNIYSRYHIIANH